MVAIMPTPPITNFPAESIVPSPCFTNNAAPTEPKPMPYNEEKNATITNNKNNSNDRKLIGNQNLGISGWSFLQSLSNAKASTTEHDKVYVHPLLQRSASKLNEKSLEMCTERLGSETGSEVSESSDDFSLLSLETVACNIPSTPRQSSSIKKLSHSSSFPPPLTSISGSNFVEVKSHREGGRLVLQAVAARPCHSYFHAERIDGRLRLSLLKDSTPIYKDEDDEEEDQEDVIEEEGEEDGEEFYEENVAEGGEVEEIGKLPRLSSCKETGRGHEALLDWEPYMLSI